jgi:hypothetical protein
MAPVPQRTIHEITRNLTNELEPFAFAAIIRRGRLAIARGQFVTNQLSGAPGSLKRPRSRRTSYPAASLHFVTISIAIGLFEPLREVV